MTELEAQSEADADAEVQRRFAGPEIRELCLHAPHIPEVHALPSSDAFFAEHVLQNVPLVIRGGAKDWRALEWSATSLQPFHNKIVQVAPLEVCGPHAYRDKWLEAAELWEHAGKEPEASAVDEQRLLVVSANRVRMRLRKFLNLLKATSKVAATFYADGAGNLEHSFAYLRDGFFSPPGFASALELKRADLWMGGRSVSRMHFDNLDNVFAQVVGHKTFVLARPADGAALQGGKRLRKARQCYAHPGQFSREGGGVMHETVLNYLGVARPPSLPATLVTLGPGDVLYLPFGWWHEVHGHPDAAAGELCASISHFYQPYYCRLAGRSCTTLGPLIVHPRYCRDDDDDDEATAEDEGHAEAEWLSRGAEETGGAKAARAPAVGDTRAPPPTTTGSPQARAAFVLSLVVAVGAAAAVLATRHARHARSS